MACRVKMGSADMERAPSFLGGLWRMRKEAKAWGQYMTNKLVWRCSDPPLTSFPFPV